MTVRIGIDFDNTIVCYDALFRRIAMEDRLIPADLPESKGAIRDYLRAAGMEDRWTAMQGEAYGKRMVEAHAFPGALECIAHLIRAGRAVFIVSHKTRYPYRGPKYDLHAAALAWLEAQGLFDRVGLPRHSVFFELTKSAKLERIHTLGCTDFIDDLPELLSDPEFPAGVRRILFDPNHQHPTESAFARLTSWRPIPHELLA